MDRTVSPKMDLHFKNVLQLFDVIARVSQGGFPFFSKGRLEREKNPRHAAFTSRVCGVRKGSCPLFGTHTHASRLRSDRAQSRNYRKSNTYGLISESASA